MGNEGDEGRPAATSCSGPSSLAERGVAYGVAPHAPPCHGPLARALVASRARLRRRLPAHLFGDPAFDVLLELYAAGQRGEMLSTGSVGLVTGAPGSTALRWIAILVGEGLIERHPDPHDRRRMLLALAPATRAALGDWLAETAASLRR